MNWLMLRGLIREQRHWMRFPSLLQSRLDGCRTFCLDAPGLGTETHRDSPTTIRAITDDIRSRWARLRDENPGPWSLLCISLGGMVGLSWCDAYPEDFKRLVLINSSAGNLNPFYERMQWGAIPQVFRIAATRDLTSREAAILRMTTALQPDVTALATEWAEFQKDKPVRIPVAVNQLFAATRFRAPDALKVPVLVLSSEGDTMVSSACSRNIAQRYAADLKMHKTAGHDLPLDDGPWVADQIAEWCAGA